jgi:methanesulfonate monooxygenase large subunit
MDPYHEFMHAVVRQTNIMTDAGMKGRKIRLFRNGHANFGGMAADYQRYATTQTRDIAKCLPGVDPGSFQSVPLFPNGVVAARGTVIRIDTTWPISPTSTLVEWRGFGVKGESEEDRMLRINHHNEFWGPCSPNMPEDAFAVEAIGKACRLGGARNQIIAREENLSGQDDGIMRGFFAAWGQYMGRNASDPRRSA